MDVKIVPHVIKKKTRWGIVDQQHGLSYVTIDGKSAGYVPIDGPYKGVFHPLAGFPEELCPKVVAASRGQLKDFLKPQPVHEPDDEPDAERATDIFEVDNDE